MNDKQVSFKFVKSSEKKQLITGPLASTETITDEISISAADGNKRTTIVHLEQWETER